MSFTGSIVHLAVIESQVEFKYFLKLQQIVQAAVAQWLEWLP